MIMEYVKVEKQRSHDTADVALNNRISNTGTENCFHFIYEGKTLKRMDKTAKNSKSVIL